MRKIIVLSFITLDGVMQSPGGPHEDPSGGFTHGGWAISYFDESMMKLIRASDTKPFALLLGRRTYEIFAAHWPFVKEKRNENPKESAIDEPFEGKLNAARKYVVSDVPLALQWNNTTLIEGDVVKEIQRLKEEDGPELQVHGSGGLIQTLLKHDLVDEFRLFIFPLTLGSGKKLFADGTLPLAFKLTKSDTSSTGVIMAVYKKTGAVQTSTVEFETPTDAELARRKRLAEEGVKN